MHSVEFSVNFHTRNKGGLIRKVPSRGFVLVFNKFSSGKYEVYRDDNSLKMNYKDNDKNDATMDLLFNFKQTNIKYYISETEDYFIVIIKIDSLIAKQWADYNDFEVRINATKAIKIGRALNAEFILAHRTYLGNNTDDDDQFSLPNNTNIDQKFNKLDMRLWDNIHIPYDSIIDQNIYKKPILNDRLYLNILYDILTKDYDLGGAQFDDYRYLRNNKHPLSKIFALNKLDKDGNISYPDIFHWNFFLPSTWIGVIEDNQKQGIINDIRDYYGEYIAFYFLFTIYYIRSLYPLIFIGMIWFIMQLSENNISVHSSTVLVLLVIIWSTVITEYWYRLEWSWRYKWGMINYNDKETPQPTFTGEYIVSKDSGAVVETHAKPIIYWIKIIFSLSTMFLCICIVISSVVIIWTLKNRWKDNTKNSIIIGIINATQIQIFNQLYQYLAVILNNFENHRLKLDYYNHLVIKRIIFIVINSFNSLFYIAFYESGFNDNKLRLISLRIQLLTLFFTAIILQNSWEIIFPYLWVKIKNKFFHLFTKTKSNINRDIQPLMQSDDEYDDDEEEEEEEENNNNNKDILQDIDNQLLRGPVRSLLDNTSEIIVLHGYIILFVVVFPVMPLLALINNYFELGIDYYNLIRSQRPIPYTSNGIGVWKTVITVFNVIAVFSNMALLCFRTDLIRNLKFIKNKQNDQNMYVLIWFFVICMTLTASMIILRNLINDQSQSTKDAIKRQRQCEKYFNVNNNNKKSDIDSNNLTV